MNILKINGQALEGIYVDAAISFNKPAKRVSTYSVPGRNGDLVIDEGTFDNVLITYPVFEKSTFPTKFDEIVNYLASLEGYQRIECSNDPQHYRLGRFVVPQDPTAKRLNRDGYWQLSFDCKPQRWLLSGEEDTEIDANPIDEYSGDIVSFEAVALDEITELKAAIEPVQSLNGQISPYPAGGGKNLCPISGGVNNTVLYAVKSGQTYTFSLTTSNKCGFNLKKNDNSGASVAGYIDARGRVSVTFTADEDFDLYLNGYSQTTGVTFVDSVTDFQLELGSTATDYAPYSNICPITGWSAAQVTRTGVNIWDEEWELGDFNNSGQQISGNYVLSKNYIPVTAGDTYYIKRPAQNIYIFGYNSSKTVVQLGSSTVYYTLTSGANTFTVPSGIAYLKFEMGGAYGTTYNNDISINYPSTDHDYHAYAGQTYPIPLGQTVYGGTLNVTTGVLTVTHAMQDLGALTWVYDSTNTCFYSSDISGIKNFDYSPTATPSIICSNYKAEKPNYSAGSGTNNTIWQRVGTSSVRIKDTAYTNATAFTTALSGVQLVYELATPTTVQLTAAEVELLLGQNNIWADTGDVEVKVTTPTVFNNPSLFNSKPLIRVYGIGTFRVNDITVTIASHDKPYIDIDCELQECYYGSENMNEYVSFSGNDFPELQPGDNYMLLASGITKLDVTPRWWVL